VEIDKAHKPDLYHGMLLLVFLEQSGALLFFFFKK
jgi:hypothetical protein